MGKYDAARGRYAVQLRVGEEILVRRINLIEVEAEWCRERQLSHTSLLAAARTVDHVMLTLFHYFPPILHRHLQMRAWQPPPTHAVGQQMEQVRGAALFPLFFDKRAERLLRKLAQSLRVPQDRHSSTAEQISDVMGPVRAAATPSAS